jgi:hypothetical protein
MTSMLRHWLEVEIKINETIGPVRTRAGCPLQMVSNVTISFIRLANIVMP